MSTSDYSHPDDFPPDLKPFEAALAGLKPARSRIDRDRLMYQMGFSAKCDERRAVPRRSRASGFVWPLATAASLLVAVGLAAVVLFRAPSERIVYVDLPDANSQQSAPQARLGDEVNLPVPATTQSGPTGGSYLVLRDQVLRKGATAMDVPAGGDAAHRTDARNRALLKQLLGS